MANIIIVRLFEDCALIETRTPKNELLNSTQEIPAYGRSVIRDRGLGFMYDDGESKWYW